MAKILLGLTGSVATIKATELARALQARGHELVIAATSHSQYFLVAEEKAELAQVSLEFVTDSEEWPGNSYTKGQEIPHIRLGEWADAMVIAPLDANTLAKIALGLSDNLLTSMLRAWDFSKPMVLAPAMNTRMWNHPFTALHLGEFAKLYGWKSESSQKSAENNSSIKICESINLDSTGLQIALPVEKVLACGDFGMGAMAPTEAILWALDNVLENRRA
jgi:phosphopantothenoylcysteine decarboxylase